MTNVIPFPSREDAVWFSGGSLHIRYGARVQPLDPDVAADRRTFWRLRCFEAYHAGEVAESQFAARRWLQFTTALDALADYERIMGRAS